MTYDQLGAMVMLGLCLIYFAFEGVNKARNWWAARSVDKQVAAHPSGALGLAQEEIAARVAADQMEGGIDFCYVYCVDCGRSFYCFPFTRSDWNRTVIASTQATMHSYAEHRATCRAAA